MIIDQLGSNIKDFLTDLEHLGFEFTLIGGAPRDFFFNGQIGRDLDFEIRSNRSISPSDWPTVYQQFIEYCASKKIHYKILPYLITRVELDEFKLEFSSPRIEKNLENNFSHHHFEALLDSNLDYKKSFLRRDFTINAIGIKFNLKEMSEEIIDPFNGLQDLKSGQLKFISKDFFNDSVRFLRLIRFHLKFEQFVIDKEILDNLGEFNLSALSSHHFIEEMFKSIPGKFINFFNQLVDEYKLIIPPHFEFWRQFIFPPHLKTREEILGFVFIQKKLEVKKVAEFLNLPKKMLNDLESFNASHELLLRMTEWDLRELCHLPLNEMRMHNFLKECKNLYEKNIWHTHLGMIENIYLFGPSDWSEMKVSQSEILKLKPSDRSLYQFYKALLYKYGNEKND